MKYNFWFVVGSQLLYGPEVLETVEARAKEMAEDYGISPRKAASILDTFSCIAQGIIPYGAQILVARMNKNKKFQKDNLIKEGYVDFVEFYQEELKN